MMSHAFGSTPKPRLGFLGVGWIGRHRLEAIARSGLAEIVAIADLSRELAEAAQVHAPEALLLNGIEPLLALPLDGLVIATPSALHAAQSIAALERGIAVFCQKPLGRSADETRRVVEAAARADRLLGVDLSYRFIRGVPELRELVCSGALGDIYAVDLCFHNAYGPDKPWFYQPDRSGGGCVMDLGIHLVDLALWMLGFPPIEGVTSRLYAGGQPLHDRERAVEEYAVARLDVVGGASLQLACSWRAPAGQEALIGATLYGTAGGAALRNVEGSFYDFTVERYHGTQRERLAGPPDEWGGRAAVAWVERLAAGERFDPNACELVTVAEALDAIYAANGAPRVGG